MAVGAEGAAGHPNISAESPGFACVKLTGALVVRPVHTYSVMDILPVSDCAAAREGSGIGSIDGSETGFAAVASGSSEVEHLTDTGYTLNAGR